MLVFALMMVFASSSFADYSTSDFRRSSKVEERSGGLVVHYDSLKDLDCDLSVTFDKDRKLVFKFHTLEVMKNKTVEFKSSVTRTDFEKIVDKALSSSDYSKVIEQNRGLLGKIPLGAKYHMAVRSINGSRFALQLVLEATKKEGARTMSVAVTRGEIESLID